MRDNPLVMSDGQAITAVGAAYSTDEVNLGACKDAWGTSIDSDPGEGGGLWLNVMVTTAFTSGTSTATLKAELVHGAATAPTTVLLSGAAIAVGSLTAGAYLLRAKLPPGLDQYTRIKYTVAGSAMTAGAVDAFISKGTESPYPH